MESSQALSAIKQLISQGNLDEAYEQLVKILDAYAHYAELADTARINQADLYQLKSQVIKGVISAEDARLTSNQLADKALQIVRQIETGKVRQEEDLKPSSSKAWRYYVVGGIVTLALAVLAWQFFGGTKQTAYSCPAFSKTAELKVMILPFKQTGAAKKAEPEFDIMDGLNDLIEKTPGLRVRAIADVNESYHIDEDYPNSAQAADIARNCDAQMLVWGKVNQSSTQDYTVDVRYRLLDAGGVRYAGDTTISRLLTVTQEASWTNDVKAITNLLYLVLANQMQVSIAANVLFELKPATAAAGADSLTPVDTSTSLILADQYILKHEEEKAIAEYDKVLSYDPDNSLALTKRGALLLRKKDYSAAARDLEAAEPNQRTASPALQKARVEAYLKSGQPDKARQEVESAVKKDNLDGAWIENKTREVNDSTQALKKRRDRMEQMAKQRPGDVNLSVKTARANLGLGDQDKALKYANSVLERDPNNTAAVEVAAEAHLQNGDTVKAQETLKSAERAGVNLKSLKLAPVRQLMEAQKKQ